MIKQPNATKQIQPKEAEMENETNELFYIEYVPAEMRELEIGFFEASAKTQAELLEAGFTLLRKLPTEIRCSLGCPVFANLTALFSQGGNPNNFTPELARAGVGVAKASLALWALMFEFGKRINKPHKVALGESIGVLVAGKQVFKIRYVIARISHGTGVSFAVATAMWEGIVEILREGLVKIPGIRAAQLPVQISGKE